MSSQESTTRPSTRHRDLMGSPMRCCMLSLLGWIVIFAGTQPLAAQQRTSEKSGPRASSGKIDSRLAQRIVQQAHATRPDPATESPGPEPAPLKRTTSRVSSAPRVASENYESFEPEPAPVRRVSYESAEPNRTEADSRERAGEVTAATKTAANPSRVTQAQHVHVPAVPVEPAPLKPTPSPADIDNADNTEQMRALQTPSDQTREVKSAGYVVAEKPAAMFLDLTDSSASPESVTGTQTEDGPSRLGVGPEVTATESPVQVVMRAVAWVIIALCVFSLGALGVRRWQRQRGLLPTSNSRSRVLETLSLGPGRTVSLIEMAGYRALVASDAGGIRQLVLASSSFTDDFAEMEQDLNTRPAPSTAYQLSDFRSQLPSSAD